MYHKREPSSKQKETKKTILLGRKNFQFSYTFTFYVFSYGQQTDSNGLSYPTI